MQLLDLVTLLRKFASLLLALCFVLPLSQCEFKGPECGPIVTKPVIFHGSDMARDGLRELEAGKGGGAMTVMLVLCVFFLPLAALACGTRIQVALHLAGSLFSGYVLFHWVFVFASHALPGGVIACLCSALLFLISAREAVVLWKNRQKGLTQEM